MGKIILTGNAFWIMLGVFVFAFALEFIQCRWMEKLLGESEDMQHAGMQAIKQMRMKYEGMCRIGKDVNDTRNFVDKAMISWKMCGIRQEVIHRAVEFMRWMCVYIGVAMAMFVYFRKGMDGRSVLYAGGGILMWIGLEMWRVTLAVQEKKEHFLIVSTDFLENMAASIKQNGVHRQDLQKISVQKFDDKEKKVKKSKKEYDERVIDDVLDEFLV